MKYENLFFAGVLSAGTARYCAKYCSASFLRLTILSHSSIAIEFEQDTLNRCFPMSCNKHAEIMNGINFVYSITNMKKFTELLR